MIRRDGEFPFPWELLKKPSDADTQVSSAFEMGCEDGNFLFPDPRGQAGKLIIFCHPTSRLCSEGAEGAVVGASPVPGVCTACGQWHPRVTRVCLHPQLGMGSCCGGVCVCACTQVCCVCLCSDIRGLMCLSVCTHACPDVTVCACVCSCVSICAHIRVLVSQCVCVHMSVLMCFSTHINVLRCVCVHTYTS